MGAVNDDILVERLTPKILSAIRTKAKPVESLSVTADLTGITSIPCYDTTGGQFKSVLVSIEALRSPASEAAGKVERELQELEELKSEVSGVSDTARSLAQEAAGLIESTNEAEQQRVSAEHSRLEAENARQENEAERISSENERVSEELVRQNAEALRLSSEQERVSSEEARILAENKREASELERIRLKEEMETLNEELKNHPPRINDEDYWEVWDAAAKRYMQTGVMARGKRPVIRDAIWWLWDDSQGDYVSSGYAVNADFQLTKAGIEGVFHGDISSHTHSHLVYIAQVYEDTPDLTSLKTWTGDDGMVHDFVLGNDIYVRDDSEPTGYANYKLAFTALGCEWIRIPQVSEGWRIVLIKNV